jgi:hypothetical protein
MNKVLILILFTWTTTTGQGLSKIPVDKLVNDFKILKTTIQEIHPDLYRYTSKAVLDREFDSLLRTINTGLTELEFYQKIAPWVALIKNGHTAIRLPDSYYNQITLLPLRLITIDNRIYIKTNFSDSVLAPYKTGQESENRFITVKLGKYDKSKKIIHTRRAIKPSQRSRAGRLHGDMSQV